MDNLINGDCFSGIIIDKKFLEDNPDEETEDGSYKFTLDIGIYFILPETEISVQRIAVKDQVVAAKANFNLSKYALFVIRDDDKIEGFLVDQEYIVRDKIEFIHK